MGKAFVREQDAMKRTRGTPLGPDLSQRAVYGSRSEPGGPQQPRFSGDAEQGGGDLDYPKRNLASAFNGQSAYSGYARADFTQSTVNLVTCVLGAGALGYPFCFKECGLVLATIIMFITLVATRISYQLMLYCAQLSMRKTYEGIAEAALGKRGRMVVEICIAAMNLGALVAFLDILADVLSAVAGTIIPPGAEPSRHAYLTGVTVLGALPVSLVVRDHALIAALSNASVAFVVIFALVVFCSAFTPIAAAALGLHKTLAAVGSTVAGGTAAATAAAGGSTLPGTAATAAAFNTPVLHMWHVQGVLVALPVMAYGFTAHQYYMGIYTMLKAPSVRKMKSVTDLALLICAGVYWTMGVGGYASFGERTAGDIIRNLGGQKSLGLIGAYARALKLCYGMAILGNIPLVLMPFYSLLRPMLPEDSQIKQGTASLAGVCTLTGAKQAAAAVLQGSSAGSGRGGLPAHSGTGTIRLPSSSAHKLKTSFGGEDEQALIGGSNGLTVAEPLLPPSWPQQIHSSSDSSSSIPQDPQRQQQQHLDPHLVTEQASYMLTATQHCLVVFIVLGLGLASAVWLPNVELIFGLTGSTASVLVAFIIPALCFINLYEAAPELGSSSSSSSLHGGGSIRGLGYLYCCCCHGVASLFSSSSSGYYPNAAYSSPSKGPVLVVPELRAQWLCRYRLAVTLLVFGIISGLLCTDAILSSISEEKAVVQLAQELVAHEAVIAEANRAQQKAKEAAAAVNAVSNAAEQLGTVTSSTNQTLGALTAAAAALNTISNGSSHAGVGSSKHSVWDLKGRLEERKQKAAEDSVLKNVEAALSAATADITATMASVTQVVIKLDKSITQIKADAAAATTGSAQQQQQPAAAAVVQPPAAGSTAAAPDGTVLPQVPAAGSSHIIPHHAGGGGAAAAAAAAGDSRQAAAAPTAAAAGSAGTPAADGAGSKSEAYDRAAEMASELGKALGVFSQSAGSSISSVTAGKSLEQVRDSALSALTALNITADVLHQVQEAVAAARHRQRRGSSSSDSSSSDVQLVREMAVQAMQRALNATAASALAVKITEDALSAAASEETSELLTALTRVAQDLEKSAAASGGKLKAAPHQGTSITVTSALAQPAAAAAAAAETGTEPAAGDGKPDNATTAGSTGSPAVVPARQQQHQGIQPTAEEAAAAAAAEANAAAHADSESHAAAADSSQAAAAAGMGSATQVITNSAAGDAVYRNVPSAAGSTAQQPRAAVDGLNAADQPSVQNSAAAQTTVDKLQQQAGTAAAIVPVTDKTAVVSLHSGASSSSVGSDSLLAVEGKDSATAQHGPSGNNNSSNSSTAASDAGHSMIEAAHAAAAVHQTAASLSATEAAKVRSVISNLATVLSTSGGSGSSSTGDATAANITALAAAIQDAVAWTQDSKAAVVKLIGDDLGKTQPKVAQRVVGIVQDISVSDAAIQQEQQQQEAAVAAVEAQADRLQQQQQQRQKSIADAAVAGPVVAVTAQGKLGQSGTGLGAAAGPVVSMPGAADMSPVAGANVAGTQAATDPAAATLSGQQQESAAGAADSASGAVVKLESSAAGAIMGTVHAAAAAAAAAAKSPPPTAAMVAAEPTQGPG